MTSLGPNAKINLKALPMHRLALTTQTQYVEENYENLKYNQPF